MQKGPTWIWGIVSISGPVILSLKNQETLIGMKKENV